MRPQSLEIMVVLKRIVCSKIYMCKSLGIWMKNKGEIKITLNYLINSANAFVLQINTTEQILIGNDMNHIRPKLQRQRKLF